MKKKYVWQWDGWQKKVLDHQGNVAIRAGRQSGKSEVISEKAIRFAMENENTVTLIIAASQRQSSLLFEKVRGRADALELAYPEKPTLTRLVLPNGSRIYSLPAGRTAYSIRGYTIDLLIADEAAFIPETVWLAVTPMLAVSKEVRGFGWLIAISTPFGKGGFFYNACFDNDFLHIHVSSEECKRINKSFLAKEKRRMTKAQYRQEYLAEFCDEAHQFFATELIKNAMTIAEWRLEDAPSNAKFYLGVDVARYGGDENAFVIAMMVKRQISIVKCMTTERVSLTDTIGRIQHLDKLYRFRKIFIDDAGVGAGVTDVLIDRLGRKVIGLNNAQRSFKLKDQDKHKAILKEDLYSNTLTLLEAGKMELVADPDLLRSLRSIEFKYTEHGNVKIYGNYTHLTEAMVRAGWCIKEKGLDMFLY